MLPNAPPVPTNRMFFIIMVFFKVNGLWITDSETQSYKVAEFFVTLCLCDLEYAKVAIVFNAH